MHRFILALASALAAVLMIGPASCAARPVPRDRAPILHVVLVKLKDPSHADAVYEDTLRVVRSTRSSNSVTRGFHFETGRAEVEGNYDLAVLMEFRDRAAYERYLSSSQHADLVRLWRPEIASIRIIDVGRERTDNPRAMICKVPGVQGPSAARAVCP